MNVDRRKFVTRSAAGAAGMILGSRLTSAAPGRTKEEDATSPVAKYDVMKEVKKYRKIDAHAHIYFTDNSPQEQLDFGERLAIDKQVISRYLSVMPGTPEQFRKYNYLTIKAIKKYPDHLLGGFVLNPTYKK